MSLYEIFGLLGGVGLFLYGMSIMSTGLRNACGEKLKTILRYTLHFLCWLLCAVLIGCACGLAGGGFAIAVEWATHTRGQLPWLLYLLPVGGLLIAGHCPQQFDMIRLPPKGQFPVGQAGHRLHGAPPFLHN